MSEEDGCEECGSVCVCGPTRRDGGMDQRYLTGENRIRAQKNADEYRTGRY